MSLNKFRVNHRLDAHRMAVVLLWLLFGCERKKAYNEFNKNILLP